MTAIVFTSAKAKPAFNAGAIRSRLPIALACFVASVVFATVAAASTPLMSWIGVAAEHGSPVLLVPAAATLPTAHEGQVRTRSRRACEGCGVVESVRPLETAPNQPASYELIVRLRDGTSRSSTTTNTAQWRAGDRIMLIGGLQPSAQ